MQGFQTESFNNDILLCLPHWKEIQYLDDTSPNIYVILESYR